MHTFVHLENLNYFNSELQLKNTESAIKKKLKNLVNELKGFKFVITLVLQLKNQLTKMKQSMAVFIRTQKQKKLLTNLTLIISLNQYIV